MVRRAGTPLVLGIDPREDDIPPAIRESIRVIPGQEAEARAARIFELSKQLVNLAYEEGLPAVKVQVAFYEAAGPLGIAAFVATLKHARAGNLIAIADVKRGDIGSTADAYGEAYFGANAPFPADAITASPYLGEDSLAALIKAANRDHAGVFVLVRTSNPGARDLQELELKDGRRFYEAVAALVSRLADSTRDSSGYGAAGAVVGATAPEAAQKLRAALPASFLLAPGVGAQGAPAAALRPFFDSRGEGALVPVSRAISGAWRERPDVAWEDACREAIRRLKAELAATLGR